MTKKTTIILFTLAFVAVFLISGFFVVGEVYNRLLDNLIDQYAQEELVLAKQTSGILENQVNGIGDKLNLLAKIPEIRDGNQEVCEKKLEEVLNENSQISNIGRVNLDKKFQCSLNKALIGTDAEKLGSYITEIFNDPNHQKVMSRIIKVPNGGYGVAVHVPVFDQKNAFIGTIGGAIYFNEFSKKFLQDVNLSHQGYIVLQDDDGTIFYHPQKGLIGQNRRPKTEQEQATASAITKLIIESSKDGTNGVSRYVSSLDNQEKVGAYAAANVFPNRKWVVVVTVPVSDIKGWPLILEARDSFWNLLLMVVVCIILPPLLLIVYLIFSVFKPLEKIGKAASEVGRGNLDVLIPIKSSDEIGSLAGFFNNMVVRLKNSYAGLEDKVEEKTSELTQKLRELENNKKATLNILEDLNEQKAQLQKKDAELSEAQSAGGIGSFIIDLKDSSVTISSQMYKLYDIAQGDGKTSIADFVSLVYPDDRQSIQNTLSSMVTSSAPIETTYRTIHKDGTIRLLKAKAQTVFSAEKIPTQIVGTIHDVTKEYEVDRMKSEFISLASHQLRTPLSAMKWFSEMLLDGDAGALNSEQKEYIKNIYDSNERMVALVNSLLNISRIESGRLIVEPKPTDLRELLNQVVTEIKPKLADKKMQIIVSVNEGLPLINIDAKLISEVFANLLTNAIKYTAENGEISVFISKKDNQIVSQVSDNGMGIPKAQQNRVFTKFFRADNAIKTEGEGTGLGLYLIKAIVESSGGKIWFTSEEGKGTSFFFSLPDTGSVAHKGEVSLNT